jgi:hypothetical protein
MEEYSTNVIPENLCAKIDEEGHHTILLQEIIDHRSTEAAL